MPAVLFVCRANQFRSPIAAACLSGLARRLFPAEKWEIGSAGTWASEGLPAPDLTLQAAVMLSLAGLAQHKTRQVNQILLESADLVIVMEAGQKEALRYEFPAVARRIHLLAEVVDDLVYDIPDPDLPGGNPQETARLLVSLISRGCDRIFGLARALTVSP
jgi:protein-tyrosine phosphatase